MTTLMQSPIVASFRKEVDRLFDRFSEGELQPVFGRWVPPADLYETDDALVVEMAIPGFTLPDVQVTLKDQLLTVRGTMKRESTQAEKRIVHRECAQSTFVRAITLPTAVDPARTKAVFHNGMLTVTMDKLEGARATAIPVQTG